MSNISPRLITLTALSTLPAVTFGLLDQSSLSQFLLVAVAGGAATFFAGSARDDKPLHQIRQAVRKTAQGKEYVRPDSDNEALLSVYDELDELRLALSSNAPASIAPPPISAPATVAAALPEEDLRELGACLNELKQATDQQESAQTSVTQSVALTQSKLTDLSAHAQALATSADESSSSVLEMSATTDEVAENIGELASNVREMVASIEEMAFSIREVATNVDELSLTAEETSSSMNQMDVAIDQVQSNADETSRLSEEVARDAELGAESILKTMGEIYRIKESSQEALGVINSLGSRIDAIGEILNVIDDVAEQTNLLALNAAIIAAQAGEHGKGFAVVADEIKDLAERAGASTKEIADLIKTIQAESKNAINAVEQSSQNVDRGVEVSNEAERALKKILESSQKSTNMVRAIARATVEQAKGSKQVTDAISRIAETVQQVAAATAEQARGSELIMKNGEKMRSISQQVERSSQEQARGSRQITEAIESINSMVSQLNQAQRDFSSGSQVTLDGLRSLQGIIESQRSSVERAQSVVQKLNP